MPIRLMLLPAVLLAALALPAQQPDLSALPHDSHQGLTIAADAYTDAARSRQRFGKKHPHGEGILAVEVYFTNESDQGIRLGLEQIELVLRPPAGGRQRVAVLGLEELLERMLSKRQPDARRRRTPIPGGPLPRAGTSRSKDWQKLEEVIQPEIFEMTFLPPRTTVRGFLFFDIGGRFDWLGDARLYVPDLARMPENEPLLFFEIPLAR